MINRPLYDFLIRQAPLIATAKEEFDAQRPQWEGTPKEINAEAEAFLLQIFRAWYGHEDVVETINGRAIQYSEFGVRPSLDGQYYSRDTWQAVWILTSKIFDISPHSSDPVSNHLFYRFAPVSFACTVHTYLEPGCLETINKVLEERGLSSRPIQ